MAVSGSLGVFDWRNEFSDVVTNDEELSNSAIISTCAT